nr:hypothetical protein TetV2_00102 [Oceanusvirus sp.]
MSGSWADRSGGDVPDPRETVLPPIPWMWRLEALDRGVADDASVDRERATAARKLARILGVEENAHPDFLPMAWRAAKDASLFSQ